VGPTSFSLVKQVIDSIPARPPKRKPSVCHGGTLDPFASGLLLILIEPATRLFDHLHAIPKVYEATVRWGIETDNGDPHGKVISQGDATVLTVERLDAVLAEFVGWREQVPHATSAKRVGGERAYVRVHRGEAVEMPPSRVYLHEAKWLSHDLPRQSRLRIVVRGGYYVRALARDLGRMLGCGAHLSALHRAAIGPWSDPGAEKQTEVHGRQIMPWAKWRELSDQDVGDLRQGQTIGLRNIHAPDWSMPDGFPDANAPVRGFHLGKLTFLLKEVDGRLGTQTALPGGL
jgi:tRNA pseudouridine55 synthase